MASYFLFLFLIPASALIMEDTVPPMLEECYSGQVHKNITPYEVQTSCLESFLGQMYKNTSTLRLGKEAYAWLDSLGRDIHIRLRRQSRGRNNQYNRNIMRVRKEIRTLSEDEREDFFDAVRALKADKSVNPNQYDVLALMHQGDAVDSAHGGPNFVSWHRYYLLLFENALRTKKRRVTLPYWDSTLDHLMDKPEDTILFTEIFLGNPKGIVYSGPFALWNTPTDPPTILRRDIPGLLSSLINPQTLQQVFKKKYHREILSPTNVEDDANLEYHHDGVHVWVGGEDGHMGGVYTSPMDPVFFLHHCYIDYLWEQFRQRQKRFGINSETDYPPTTDTYHSPSRIMDNLKPPKKNSDGYSNSFTRNIYRYEPAPSCKNNCGRAKKGFLFCDRKKRACVARSRYDFRNEDGFKSVRNWYQGGRKIRIPQSVQTVEPVRNINPNIRTLAGPAADSEGGVPSGFDLKVDQQKTRANKAPKLTRKFKARIVDPRTKSRQRRSIDQRFASNNVRITFDIDMHLRQEMGNNNSLNWIPYNLDNWAVAPIAITNKHDKLHTLDQNQRTFNITFQTDGFSYRGRHTEYITVDERTLTSESVGSIAFENPVSGETKAFVRAYDSYGKLCKPSCLVSQSRYKECSGMIKVTSDYPHMYVDSYNGASDSDMKPFLKFDCMN
ncbi:tyrosinase-like protein [Mytilus trossulus]|uniref:tyrosinase-like protein n=1 Tax=Mytilus trossulus TaxID=6551 RepID=UPI00300651EC